MRNFTAADVVRHELVMRIVEAYDKEAAKQARAAGMTRAARSALKIDVMVDCKRWKDAARGQIDRAACRHAGSGGHPVNKRGGACYRPDR